MEQIEDAAEGWFERGVALMNGDDYNGDGGADDEDGDSGGGARGPDLPGAVAAFSRALFLAPDSAPLLQHRGEALLRLCDFASSLRDFRRAHRLDPGAEPIRARLAQLHFILGRLHLDGGESARAVASFSAALALQPDNTDFWIWRIKSWTRGRSYGRALHELNHFIASPDGAGAGGRAQARMQTQSNEEHKEDADAHAHAYDDGAETDAEADAFSAALSGSSRVAASASNSAPASDPTPLPASLADAAGAPALLAPSSRARATSVGLWRTVQALILRAKLHVLLERSDLALRDATWAGTLAPSNPEVAALLESLAQKADSLYGSATAHLLAGQTEPALVALSRALELAPREVKFYALRASLLRQCKRYDESLRDLKTALHIVVSVRQARALEARRREQASSSAAAAAGGPQSEEEPRLAGGQTFLSEVAINTAADACLDDSGTQGQDQHGEAQEEEKDEQQIALEKSLALTFNGLGVQYYEEHQYSHGMSCLSKAISLDGSVSSFFANRGDCLLALHETAQALSDFHTALSLIPTTGAAGAAAGLDQPVRAKIGLIHSEQGRAHFNRGDYPAASVELTRALVADPRASAHFLSRARTFHAMHEYEKSYRDAERAVQLRPGDAVARAFLVQLRQALLRPSDLARAPPLPPLPAPDTPLHPSGNHALRQAAAQAEEDAHRRRMAQGAPKYPAAHAGFPATAAQRPGGGGGVGGRRGASNGREVMRLVFGDQLSSTDAAAGGLAYGGPPPITVKKGRRAR